MFSKELEEIIDAALADGVITDVERRVLHKRALAEGVDPDELDVVIDGRLAKAKKQEDWLRPAPPQQLANEKHGNIVKCPSCGAQVVGGSAVCPECGYTYANIKENSSIKKFQEQLNAYNKEHHISADRTDVLSTTTNGCLMLFFWPFMLLKWFFSQANPIHKRKMDIITTFPVPNTRGDLLEFLTAIQMRINPFGPKTGCSPFTGNEDMSYAYWLLFSNCINKAQLSFRKDQGFVRYFNIYDENVNKSKSFVGWVRTNPKFTIALAIVVFYIIYFALMAIFVNR